MGTNANAVANAIANDAAYAGTANDAADARAANDVTTHVANANVIAYGYGNGRLTNDDARLAQAYGTWLLTTSDCNRKRWPRWSLRKARKAWKARKEIQA